MGFIEKRSGKYRARYRDAGGRQRSKKFTLKADAERFVREEEIALERGAWIDPRAAEMTLAEWCDRFMSLARRLADTTQQTYQRDLDRYVLPRFGSYRLGRLAAEEIEEWLLDEIDSGLAASSVHRHYRTLHRVLEVAVKHKRIASNPCGGVQPPTVPRRRMAILDWPQVFEVADALAARYRALIFLAVDAGMRWSELVGLRRSRVDVRASKVEVVEQLIRLNTGEWVWHPPKSEAGVRTIAIPSRPSRRGCWPSTWRRSQGRARTGWCS